MEDFFPDVQNSLVHRLFPVSVPPRLCACEPVGAYEDFLKAVVSGKQSCIMMVDVGFGVKKLFIENGALVFASSNMMEDRLGEIIYRRGWIALDELTECAALVTRDMKFGHVLVQKNVKSILGLWECLKLQVYQILKSTLMNQTVYYEVGDFVLPPTKVVFEEGASHVLASALRFGWQFRVFIMHIDRDTGVATSPVAKKHKDEPQNYVLDMFGLLQDHKTVDAFLKAAKLSAPYALQELFHLTLSGMVDLSPVRLHQMRPDQARLDPWVKAYQDAKGQAQEAFQRVSKSFPSDTVLAFLRGLQSGYDVWLHLDEACDVRPWSGFCMSQVAEKNHQARLEVHHTFEGLIKFLLQVALDHARDLPLQANEHIIR